MRFTVECLILVVLYQLSGVVEADTVGPLGSYITGASTSEKNNEENTENTVAMSNTTMDTDDKNGDSDSTESDMEETKESTFDPIQCRCRTLEPSCECSIEIDGDPLKIEGSMMFSYTKQGSVSITGPGQMSACYKFSQKHRLCTFANFTEDHTVCYRITLDLPEWKANNTFHRCVSLSKHWHHHHQHRHNNADTQ